MTTEEKEQLDKLDSYEIVRPIIIDGETHVMGVNTHPSTGEISINHSIHIEGRNHKEFSSVTFPKEFLESLITTLQRKK